MASPLVANSETFSEFLEREQEKDLLRFTTAGSVDDGKSTLIGRLLYDSRSVYDDQLESVTKASAGRNAGAIDFSLLTDGLRAEREQGITIDMVTGASTAELAIVLVDARKGVLPQSRRHSYIAGLLGIERVVIAINKMDLVGYEESVFAAIEKDFRAILARFPHVEPYFVPVSALAGDNIVTRSKNMPWFDGQSLLEHLETVPVGGRLKSSAFRFPVQRVVRPSHEFRGYAGTIVAGSVRPGDAVTILPSGRETTIASIVTFDGNLNYADAGQAVTLTLSQEIDLSRGDFIVSSGGQPLKAHGVKATLVWLNEKPAEIGRRYRIKHASRQDWATLRQIDYRLNINTLEQDSVHTLEMNAIGEVTLETARLLCFDLYEENRATGSFVLIDAATNATVAAGMITGPAETSALAPLAGIAWHVKDGALVLTSEQGFTTKPGLSDEPLAMEDPEALEALRHMLRRLRVAPFGSAGESDFEI
jgi:sulfate adenylyltransferase large subunit